MNRKKCIDIRYSTTASSIAISITTHAITCIVVVVPIVAVVGVVGGGVTNRTYIVYQSAKNKTTT